MGITTSDALYITVCTNKTKVAICKKKKGDVSGLYLGFVGRKVSQRKSMCILSEYIGILNLYGHD